MWTRRRASALHSRVKTFNMAFRHLCLSVSRGKVRHHRTEEHFKDASSCERAFPPPGHDSVTSLALPPTGAIQACSIRGH